MRGKIVKSTGLWYVVWVGGELRDARLKGKYKKNKISSTNPIAVGDWVEIEKAKNTKNEWVITRIYDRKNYVIRSSPKRKGMYHMLASNIDQCLVIVTLKKPRTSTGFIDRVLVTLSSYEIPTYIIYNKSDIYTEEDLKKFFDYKFTYESIGYQVILTSFLRRENTIFLNDILNQKTTLLIGHSGTGKSTLVNALIPHLQQKVKEVSYAHEKGVHTTTFSEMFTLSENSFLIDTPGIKELGISEIGREELANFFPEMRNKSGECKYHNCIHQNEPNCAVKKSLENGDVATFRYENYINILESILTR